MLTKIMSRNNLLKVVKTLQHPTKSHSNVFNDLKYSENYFAHWLKYPESLFSLFDTKLQTSTELVDDILKKKYQRGPGGLWKKALDVGCGPGNTSKPLKTYFRDVTGLDSSETQVAIARKNFGDLDGMTFKVCDASRLTEQICENSVDLVCVGTAVHWFDSELFFQESLKVLRPGGLMVLYSHEPMQHTIEEARKCRMEFFFQDMIEFIGVAEMKVMEKYRTYEPALRRIFSSVERNESVPMELKLSFSVYKDYLSCLPAYNKFKQARPHSADPLEKYINRLRSVYGAEEFDYKTIVYCLFCRKD